jgi:flagellar protein FlaI
VVVDGESGERVIKRYKIKGETLEVEVNILDSREKFVKEYVLNMPEFGTGTRALLEEIKSKIVMGVAVNAEKMLETKFMESVKEKFRWKAAEMLKREAPNIDDAARYALTEMLINEMAGLGKLEFVLNDPNLEEIVINSATEPAWFYHKEFGWLKSNVFVAPESEIHNYASIIARRVGKQITILNPLLDAHLATGDRANATLFPVSSSGNTITIRRFRRQPWTVTDFIKNKTANPDVMALIWLAVQYELNIIISGGTASGKTSFLNSCMPFIQPNHRIISIEDTREVRLPSFLHWVPLTTREPNPEGKGGVSMLDLLVNSLRMRPDRILVGEIRRQQEAEVMFEAMHTGHSVYTTVHANTAEETVRRLTNPPIDIPPTMLDAVHLNVVMFRNRRLGVRRILQLAEMIPKRRSEEHEVIEPNVLYRWMPKNDKIAMHAESIRFMDELSLHTGFGRDEIVRDLAEKRDVLKAMVKQEINAIDDVGKVFANYYRESNSVIEKARGGRRLL